MSSCRTDFDSSEIASPVFAGSADLVTTYNCLSTGSDGFCRGTGRVPRQVQLRFDGVALLLVPLKPCVHTHTCCMRLVHPWTGPLWRDRCQLFNYSFGVRIVCHKFSNSPHIPRSFVQARFGGVEFSFFR